ncbi:MAG: alpha/beta fold hydrolase [Pseudomonadota bacterium]
MRLAQTVNGAATGTPLVIAHGLFGSARNWGVIAKRLGETRPVISVDMRNHGESDWSDSHSYPNMAHDLAEAIPDQADLLGHSMGGKAAMALALTQPAKIRKLIVADIAPVAYGHTQGHLIAAMRRIDLGAVTTRGDADRQLACDIDDPGVRAFLLQSLDIKARRWRLNLDALDNEMPKILGFPDVTGQFPGPTLFLTGATSDYVQRAHRDHIRTLFPNVRFASLPGAGHWLHADKPREFEAAVRVFLDNSPLSSRETSSVGGAGPRSYRQI